jgi:hypothetical protein
VTVNTTADQIDPAGSTTVSLRDALAKAAADTTDSSFTINFSSSVFATAKTINLSKGTLSLNASTSQSFDENLTITGPAAGVTINAGGHSGVFDLEQISDITLSNLTIAGSSGIGLQDIPPDNGGNLTLTNVDITGSKGAGVYLNDHADLNDFLTATDCSITGNTGDGIDAPATTIVNSTVATNAWGINMGTGGAQGYGSFADLTGDTVSGNKLGGVIADDITATNSTISGNLGYGIQFNDFVTPSSVTSTADGTLINLTIANNKGGINASKIPATQGFGEDLPGPFFSIGNSIVAGNTTSSTPTDVAGAVISRGHNLIGVASGKNAQGLLGGWVSSDIVGSASSPKNPQLSALGNYGGLTNTMLPAANSLVVDAGSNSLIPSGITTDQRGDARIFGASVDIGAVEVRYCTITGTVFNDLNKNGTQNSGEAGLANQTVFLDLNDNGKLDSGEPEAITNSSGVYTFTKIPAATYHVDWLPVVGFSAISPSSGSRVAIVATGQTLTGQNFALNVKTKRTGTTIGTAGSYGNSGNTIAKATDGNLSTFFDGPTANGDWVGLDLGSAKTISQIAFAPRSGYTSRMDGGKFQISTSANFTTGVTTLYTISSAPTAGSLTILNLASTVTARYVRYLGPNGGYGDIAEFQVFG